jgi:uncharacterized protein
MFDVNGMEVLGRGECLRLLATASVGRVAVTEQEMPDVRPVHYAVIQDDIVLMVPIGGSVAKATFGSLVAFEADDIDEHLCSGWSVVVLGHPHHVPDVAGLYGPQGLGLHSWALQGGHCVVRIPLEQISGRRLPVA